MDIILIHTKSQQQIKLFEDLTIALGIDYERKNEARSATIAEETLDFMQEFNEAQKTGVFGRGIKEKNIKLC